MKVSHIAAGLVLTAAIAGPVTACPWHKMGGARFSALGHMMGEYGERPWGDAEAALPARTDGAITPDQMPVSYPAAQPPSDSKAELKPAS
ncbi:hypothetical protein [Sphingomonas sp. Root710]|uniref:hypothetical protein n=1 Tax=Sphingomonas sp. Root710 TaxID=1736594 RepID=UPI000AB94956|nr:hypothetical protein [Sphingomonas sp. Root710]